MIILPILLLIILLSNDIVTLIFGNAYSNAAIPLVILSLGISMNMLTGFTGSMLVGKGNTKLNLCSEIIGGIINVSLNIYLIPIYGLIGAALGTSISYLARNVASTYFVYKVLKIHPFKREYLKIIGIWIFLFVILFLVKDDLFMIFGNILGIVIISIITLILYSLLILFTKCLDEEDYYILNNLMKNLKSIIKQLFSLIDS